MIPIETYFKNVGLAQRHGFRRRRPWITTICMQAQDEARVLLRAYRHLGPKDDDTFAIVTSDSLVNLWNQLTGAIAATAVGVVSVFMVVGGVVIMNIMLAVVTRADARDRHPQIGGRAAAATS